MSRFGRDAQRWARNQRHKENDKWRKYHANDALRAFALGEGNKEHFRHLMRAPGPRIGIEKVIDFVCDEIREWFPDRFGMSQAEVLTITRTDIVETLRVWGEQAGSCARK